jgi:hypothetical protein
MEHEPTDEDKKAGQELVDTLYLRLNIPERDGREFVLLSIVKELLLTLRKKEILSDAEIQNLLDQSREKHTDFYNNGIAKESEKAEESDTKEAYERINAAGIGLLDNFAKKVLS